MFRLRLVELPMPTGSRDPDVLLAWLLDSMGLVRRKVEGGTIDEGQEPCIESSVRRFWKSH